MTWFPLAQCSEKAVLLWWRCSLPALWLLVHPGCGSTTLLNRPQWITTNAHTLTFQHIPAQPKPLFLFLSQELVEMFLLGISYCTGSSITSITLSCKMLYIPIWKQFVGAPCRDFEKKTKKGTEGDIETFLRCCLYIHGTSRLTCWVCNYSIPIFSIIQVPVTLGLRRYTYSNYIAMTLLCLNPCWFLFVVLLLTGYPLETVRVLLLHILNKHK